MFKWFSLLPLLSGGLFAQTPSPPPYLELRFDEDYSYLKNPDYRIGFWDPLKYIPLNDSGWYLSLGGESRIRHEFFRNAGFGAVPNSPNGFLIQRYLFHVDTHLGEHVRVFTQMQSGLENGRVGGPRVTDKNTMEVHQAFVDFKTSADPKHSLTLRVGRQELEFGAGHYLSAAEVFNVRRSFDGARLTGNYGKWTFHGIAARIVDTRPGAFDDVPDHGQTIWAAGLIGPHPIESHGQLSVYYIGYDHKLARFDKGTGRETRHTIGSRSFGKRKPWDYSYELMYQLGSFRGGSIRAWAAAAETGITFDRARLAPRFGIRADITSGDRDPLSQNLGTFNPMYPGTAYSGKIGLIGPQNVFDITPNVRLRLHRRVYLLPETSFFWRESLDDAIYGVLGTITRTGRLSRARYVGAQATVPLQIQIDRHLTFTTLCTRFFAGPFLKETPPGRSVTYVTTFLTYKF